MRYTDTSEVTIDHEKLTFTHPAFETSIRLDKIRQVSIDEEITIAAAEQEVDPEKLLSWEPELAKLLRVRFVASNTDFIFTVTKEQGTPVARHFASRLPDDLFRSRHHANSIRSIEYYPFHTHVMTEGMFA